MRFFTRICSERRRPRRGRLSFAAFCLAVVLVALSLPAWAQYQAGLDAFNRGDYATAFREFKTLAEQGDVSAQFLIGAMYAEGEGVPRDYGEAASWFLKAAEQGSAQGQFGLGAMYDQGTGVQVDFAEALKWYRKSAMQGYAPAMLNLGSMYKRGSGVPQDYVLAHMWYNLGAARGNEKARNNREIIENQMTSDQIAAAQRFAREWRSEPD